MLLVSIKILHRESKEVFREAKGIIKGMKIALEVKKKLEDRRGKHARIRNSRDRTNIQTPNNRP